MTYIPLNRDVCAHIFTFLSSPRDLLAVGLANKVFWILAEPELVYRHIRCKLDNPALWKHLITNFADASRVRRLEIQRENPSVYFNLDERETVPKSIPLVIDRPPTENPIQQSTGSESLLVQAVRNMANLESFIWDRWVPFINQGADILWSAGQGSDETETHREDIWTVLRDHTKIDHLKVVDLGRTNSIFSDCRPIFDSTLFTLRNLVVLDLKIYYSPENDQNDVEDHVRGRVKTERIRDLLNRCPNLENLSLKIIDRQFYYTVGGNPFTDITPIISNAAWPRLTSLQLLDVVVEDIAMINFLWRHPNIQKLSAFLSFTSDDLPSSVPFSFESHEISIRGILPRLEHVDLPPNVLRSFLRVISRPANLQSIKHLEPQDWGADEISGTDTGFLTSLDDVWESVSPRDGVGMNVPESELQVQQDNRHLLGGMPRLRKLSVVYISHLKQLQKLNRLTPKLEHLHITDPAVQYDISLMRHIQIIHYISQWTNLISFRGPCLWPYDEYMDIWSEDADSIARETVLGCPNLRYLSWNDGRVVEITKNDNGEFLGLEFANVSLLPDSV